ncbi:MAG: TIGR00153 family protein [Deltaproteobacteria bacterium]|nr:TIGR00153 family protein [Deltaproteobacteria bacterium]
MGIFKRDKEEEVKEMILHHMKKVEECLEQTLKVMTHFFQGRIEESKSEAMMTDHLEREADHIRRTIVDSLGGGAFLPIFRVDIHNFVEKMDQIADKAEFCCDFFLGQRPQFPEEFKGKYLKIMKETVPMFHCLKEATENFLTKGDNERIRKGVAEIRILESAIDDAEWKITREIFTSDLPLAEKIHLKQCLRRVTSLSDQIEDTSDWLEVLLISKKV